LAWRQAPGVAGAMTGRAEPRARETGRENVKVIGVLGEITAPGAGEATAPARLPAGNHVI
jgi:hypothetical protein